MVDPGNATAHANLGYLLALRGRHEEAVDEAERAIALDPAGARPGRTWGCPRSRWERSTTGWRRCRRAVRLDPEQPLRLGRAWAARCWPWSRPDEAETAWASAARRQARTTSTCSSRWPTALAAQDKTGEALRVLHRATPSTPESARAWTQLGVVALVRQDHGTAGEALLRALDLEPAHAEARFHLALLHVLVGAVEEATTALRDLSRAQGKFAADARTVLEQLDA